MAIRAVAFDIGDVLERVGTVSKFYERWGLRLGLPEAEWRKALATVDPDRLTRTGGITEAQLKVRYATALGLSAAQADEFMAGMWDWYCGELDTEMTAYAASLRPRYKTAILSNSIDGARREEQARYGFGQLVDVVLYSHEIGLAKPDPRAYRLLCDTLGVAPGELVFIDDLPENVDAASDLGIHAVLHESTPDSIKAVNSLLAAPMPESESQ
jgi:epoxide hydrolase-like predicted phosphatase